MILITGAAGFIGSCLIKKIVNTHKIIGIDDFSNGSKDNLIKHKNFTFLRGDCGDSNLLKKIKNIKIIIHIAGQSSGEKSFEDPLNDFKRNTYTTHKLLDYAVKNNCKQFIYTSSMSVYGNQSKKKLSENTQTYPNSFYGLSKKASENSIIKFKEKGINYTILRIFNVYGSEQKLKDSKHGMIRIYLTQIFKKKSLIIKGSGKRLRDFIHIDDLLKYFEIIINNKKFFNKTLNVATGKRTSVQSLVSLIKKKINFKFKVKYQKGTKDDQFSAVADIKRIAKLSKFKPQISLNEGLNEIIRHK